MSVEGEAVLLREKLRSLGLREKLWVLRDKLWSCGAEGRSCEAYGLGRGCGC